VRARLQEHGVADVTMAPGTSGQFDVTRDGTLLYSKHLMGRFPVDAEIDHWASTGQPEAAFAKAAGQAPR
jgi:predicted Rdx family selenoprotein